jgi:hypothetical protein
VTLIVHDIKELNQEILACRDEATLERWWEAAWTAKDAADILG